jgi:hypothetical protein
MPDDYVTCSRCRRTCLKEKSIWLNGYKIKHNLFCGHACVLLHCIGQLTEEDRAEVAQAWADAIGH